LLPQGFWELSLNSHIFSQLLSFTAFRHLPYLYLSMNPTNLCGPKRRLKFAMLKHTPSMSIISEDNLIARSAIDARLGSLNAA
jgi:hypothetical protein